jgi:hypothetical protein
MKGLLIGIVLLALIGTAGFLYRNQLEHRPAALPGACTLDAKICPDGTAVGRTGPDCAFAACPAGNVEDAGDGIAFALPDGYAADSQGRGADTTLIGAYLKAATTTQVASITVHAYPIPDGGTAEQVMLEHTLLEPSDMHPKDAGAFTPKVIGTHTFRSIVVERFEGVVESAYYLPRADDVLRFDIVEKDVEDWSSPDLVVDSLPEHQAFLKMLAGLQVQEG